MLSRNLQRLVTWLAFAAALIVPVLVPALARAAILPACENHELTPTPPEWLAPTPTILPDACSVTEIRNDEDAGDPRVAAMCSESGASVVAPPRVAPVVDARIEAVPGCGSEVSAAPVIGPGPKDSPVGPPAFALADHAVLDEGLLVPPAASELAPPYPAAAGEARAGVRQGIDHPPR
ncbi:MAG: hypothetical protein QM820_25755 [Minicystis sp.]